MGMDEIASIGKRLRKVAPEVCRRVHGQIIDETTGIIRADEDERFEANPYKTILHGDPKAANFFYKRRYDSEQSIFQSAGMPSVGMIDFQWTGIGLPGVDLAYCLAASADASVLDADELTDSTTPNSTKTMRTTKSTKSTGVGSLLADRNKPTGEDFVSHPNLGCIRFYHKCFLDALVRLGKAKDVEAALRLFPYAVLQRQFREAMVDLFRAVVSEWWKTITPEIMRTREGKMTFNACNKSVAMAMWLVKSVGTCLSAVEMDIRVEH